jgi:hypothetical protein
MKLDADDPLVSIWKTIEVMAELCWQNQILPALILLYSSIDSLAWLDMPASQQDVTRSDFMKWAETYILSKRELPCTSIDLYAARCSLLHTQSFESRLSRRQQAREIYYTYGLLSSQPLQNQIDLDGRNAVAVNIDELVLAFLKGAEQFFEELYADPARLAVAQQRGNILPAQAHISEDVDDFVQRLQAHIARIRQAREEEDQA